MSTAPGNEESEFTLYQNELDAAFHSRTDPFPAGTPEHAELLAFVCKLHKLRKSRPDTAPDGGGPADPQLAARLGLPASYDARFRINTSVVIPPERLGTAVRAIARRMAQRAAASGQRREGQAAGSSRGEASGTRHGSSGAAGSSSGGMSAEMVEAASQVVEEYRRLLPWYEDFFQRRQMARLRKLQADRAALPAAAFREAIVSALSSSQALVVAGDTGCGKSTQIPQFLVAAGYRRVAVTQPRRISAVSLARRVAVESCDAHGTSVAYKVRFSSSVAADSRIVFCTEGILLRELVGDPTLASYDVVVLDEVHERHLTTDFLLALLRALLFQRPELRLVLMSATINCAAFADYFGGAPIVQIPGRLYPIQLVYVPPETQSEEVRRRDVGRRGAAGTSSSGSRRGSNPAADQIDPAPYQRLLQRIDSEVPSNQRGDLLIFVAGTADITSLCTALAPYAEQTRRWILLPLHASLALEAQEKVFDVAPEGVRKAIIATNIAETSLTIDGVRFVADSGRAKEMIHDVASGGGSLQEGWISRASADQRKGRAGRTGPGTCYRMYSEAQYNETRPFSAPEIARVRLEAVVLGIKAMAGSSMDPRVFGFIDPPPPDRLEAAITNLKQIGALSSSEALTPLGAVLSLLPVDVAIGKLLVLGCMFGLAGPALTLAAALSVQSPFLKLGEEEQDQEAKAARAALVSPHGDALTLLNVFEAWLAVKQRAGGAPGSGRGAGGGGRRGGGPEAVNSSRWCRRHGLAEARLYEMAKLRAQFTELLADAGILRAGGGSALSAGQGAQHRHRHRSRRRQGGPGGLRGAELHAAKRRLRDMQAERERQRGRKVLKVEGGSSSRHDRAAGASAASDEGGSSSSASSSGEEELERLHDLDLRVHVDVGAMAAESSRPLSPGDLGLLRHLLAASLYPRLAVGDDANQQRREQDCRFHTAQVSDLVVHPGSSLFGFSNSLPRGQVLLYQELIETRRQYLSGLTPLWSLPALLLVARRLDCDAATARWLVDGWLLLRLHDGSGPKVLQLVMQLRGGASHLIATRLRAANLAALSAVQTAEEEDGAAVVDDGGGGGAATVTTADTAAASTAYASDASQSFQKAYASLAAALPEELRPLLSGVMAEQAAWRRDSEARRRRQQEKEQRRRAREAAAAAAAAASDGAAAAAAAAGEADDDTDDSSYGKDAGTAASEATVDAELEETLARQLALDMWPCRYSLERLPPGNKVTAQFIIDHLKPQLQPPQSQPQGEAEGQQPDGAAASVGPAAAAGGSVSGAAAVGVEADPLGVPYKCAGVWLAPWLRYGSLRGFESAMALHALQPALRKPWLCPGCGVRLVATFAEVRSHVEGCEAVRGVEAQAVETMGYTQAATAPGGDGGGPTGRQRGDGARAGGAAAQDTFGGPLSSTALSSAGCGGAGGAQRREPGADDGGGGGHGDGGGDSYGADDAVARLEQYITSPVTWCRRRTATATARAEALNDGAVYGTRGVGGGGASAGWAGRRDGGEVVSGLQAAAATAGRVRDSERQQAAHGGMSRQEQAGAEALLSSRRLATGADARAASSAVGAQPNPGGSGGAAAVGSGEGTAAAAMPPATARPFKCPVCGLEALMTPPQILQHRRQHG